MGLGPDAYRRWEPADFIGSHLGALFFPASPLGPIMVSLGTSQLQVAAAIGLDIPHPYRFYHRRIAVIEKTARLLIERCNNPKILFL